MKMITSSIPIIFFKQFTTISIEVPTWVLRTKENPLTGCAHLCSPNMSVMNAYLCSGILFACYYTWMHFEHLIWSKNLCAVQYKGNSSVGCPYSQDVNKQIVVPHRPFNFIFEKKTH